MHPQDTPYPQLIDPGAPEAAALVGTARIGAELRAVRERAGWRLEEVAAELRIREPFLDAIERGNLEALPGPAYQLGFIRAYAQILGLDGDEILRRFRAEGVGATRKPELSFLAPVPDHAVPTGAIVLLGVVLLLVGYGFWFLHTQHDRNLAASVPPVPQQLAPLAVPPTPPAPVVQKPPAAVATASGKPPTPGLTAGPTAVAATTPATPVVSTPGAPAIADPAPEAAQPPLPGPGKTILATADSWVEVRDATGNILFSRLMHSGDSWPVPDMPGLTLTSGNAGGTEIADNGTPGPALGAAGSVLHNYALTPAGPGTNTAAAPVAAAAATLPPPAISTPASTSAASKP